MRGAPIRFCGLKDSNGRLGGGPFGMAVGVEFPGVGEIGRSAGVVEEMVGGVASTADVI